MANISKNLLDKLRTAAIEKYKANNKVEVHIINLKLFESISIDIKNHTGMNITKHWLYKSVYLQSRKVNNTKTVGLNTNYVNTLSEYAYGKSFSEYFKNEDSSDNTDLASIRDDVEHKIKIKYFDDSEKPEFPPNNPCFPVTPTIKIIFENYNSLYIKNEGANIFKNFGGTHKTRSAWEVYLYHGGKVEEKIRNHDHKKLPSFSMISSGSYAISIFLMSRCLLDSPITLNVIYDPQEVTLEIQEEFKKLANSNQGFFNLFPTNLENEYLNTSKIKSHSKR